jgi:hypothetical protein
VTAKKAKSKQAFSLQLSGNWNAASANQIPPEIYQCRHGRRCRPEFEVATVKQMVGIVKIAALLNFVIRSLAIESLAKRPSIPEFSQFKKKPGTIL